MSTTVALCLTAVLVLVNAFFVASEFAFVKMRPTRVQQLIKQGRRRARLLGGITSRMDTYLSVSQLGITLASLALGWIGEPAVSQIVQPYMVSLGQAAHVAAHSLALTVSLLFITFVHAVLGELVPKSFALQYAEPVALWAATPMRVIYVVAFPFIWMLRTSSSLFLRLFGLRPVSEVEMVHSPEEMRMVLAHASLDPGARRLIDRVFDYTHRVARHVMTLRRDCVVLETERPFADNLKIALGNQYTRYPLVEPASDRVVGYVHLKDVVATLAVGRVPERMRDLLREPIYCREDTPLEWLRREFQKSRVHIAVVLDASNKFIGIVTMEDLLEEFVGEIQDEQDVGEIPPLVRATDGRFEADGRVTLDVAKRDLALQLPLPLRPDVETLGAYVEAVLGRPAMPGDAVVVGNVRLSALEIRDGKIRRLRGEPVTPPEGAQSVPES